MEEISLMGVKLSVTHYDEIVSTFDKWIQNGHSHQVCVGNVHTFMKCVEDAELMGLTNRSSMVIADGMPLIWAVRSLEGRRLKRVTGPDLLDRICRESVAKGYRHFFYGGRPEVSRRLPQILASKFPGIQVVGAYSPPFRPLTDDEDAEVINMINEARPDFLWVGLGAPKQEKWISTHLGRIEAPVQIGVGAAFDFVAEYRGRAPKWMQNIGLEWFHRLCAEPRRLWKRYLVYNTRFVATVFSMLMRKHRR